MNPKPTLWPFVEPALAVVLAVALLWAWTLGTLGPTRVVGALPPSSRRPHAATGARDRADWSVLGRVVDSQGRPVEGARVTARLLQVVPPAPASAPGPGELGVLPGPLPYPNDWPAPASAPATQRAPRHYATATTAPDGTFRLAGIGADEFVLEAEDVTRRCSDRVALRLQAGSATTGVEVAISEGTAVTGRVTDGRGAPLRGAVVAPALADSVGVQTDADGRYRLGPLCGAVALQATHPGRRRQTQQVVLQVRDALRHLDFALAEDGVTLRGRVLDARERPVAGARVAVSPGDAAAARTDARGDFAVTGLAAGPCRVTVEAGGFATLSRDGALPGEDLVLRLAPGASLTGLVRAARSQMTVPGTAIELRPPDGASRPEVRQEGARFEARGLSPGRYRLSVRAPGFAARALEVEVPAANRAGEVTVQGLVVELERGAVVTGEVRDGRGDWLAGTTVTVGGRSVVSGPRGDFRVGELPAGEQVLRARRRGFADFEIALTLRAGDETRGIDVRMSPLE